MGRLGCYEGFSGPGGEDHDHTSLGHKVQGLLLVASEWLEHLHGTLLLSTERACMVCQWRLGNRGPLLSTGSRQQYRVQESTRTEVGGEQKSLSVLHVIVRF